MKVVDLLLQSMILTGRVTVLIVFGVLGVAVVLHLVPRAGSLRRSDPDSARSIPGFLLTLLLGAAVPLCVWREWGSVAGLLPLPLGAALSGLGAVSTFAALSFLIWARLALGRSAHFLAGVDQGARLVTAGPFAIVRHPIYFGLGLLFFSTALAALSAPALAVALGWWPLASYRARLEDEVLHKAFGTEFEAYRERVPSLVPHK